ncbi:unnamed protein product [Paramecium octaurelia]|uniref:Uncharacterized protein n=1 Tax=Paramecium octaurelia TaxID=43137 RepID=A0A8S1T8U0_PAROT|nr:unnamed protein product [Paramecium octaurelia]
MISSSVALVQLYLILQAIDSLKSYGSQETIEIYCLRNLRSQSQIDMPSKVISPELTSYSLKSSQNIVDLPQPEHPTKPTLWPASILILKFFKTIKFGLYGQEKITFLNSILPRMFLLILGCCSLYSLQYSSSVSNRLKQQAIEFLVLLLSD